MKIRKCCVLGAMIFTLLSLSACALDNADKFQVTVINEKTDRGSVTGDGQYKAGSLVTLTATPVSNAVFFGWFNGPNLVSDELSYTFEMPEEDYSIKASFKWKKEVGALPRRNKEDNSFTFGMFPKTKVASDSLVEELEKITIKNEFGYVKYGDEMYVKEKASPVKFTNDYRYSFEDGTDIIADVEYWYLVEVIEWNSYETHDNTYSIISKNALYSHRFNEYWDGKKTITDESGNELEISNEDYAHSEIRTWLNSDFYNRVFLYSEESSNTIPIDSFGTDKISLFRATRTTNGTISELSKDESKAKSTDYCLASGCYSDLATKNAYYSMTTANSHGYYCMGPSGYIDSEWTPEYNFLGVRPIIELTI